MTKTYFQYNYEKAFLLCYEQNAGDFQFLFSSQRGGVEKAQVFPTAQGVISLERRLCSKSKGWWKTNQRTGNNKVQVGEAESFWNWRVESWQDWGTPRGTGRPHQETLPTQMLGCGADTVRLKLNPVHTCFCPGSDTGAGELLLILCHST